jgi:hypothetical protein
MWLEASNDLVQEHAYLVARHVRPLAIVGQCATERFVIHRVQAQLAECGCSGAIGFVEDRGDGIAEYGYAAHSWVLELYRWLGRADENAMPTEHRHRILGLLLGYGVEAVQRFEEQMEHATRSPYLVGCTSRQVTA